jgi:DNA-nicking Smr family endonuclease
LAELYDLVAGRAAFDITDTEEYIEGCVIGLDGALVRKLRQGDFSRQAALDLHGMKAEEAQVEVEKFLSDAVQKGLRCVLIVHGRGRNSPGQVPVLKDRLKLWLTRGKLARSVLAFSSSRPYDGGPGALYVLLRRDRARKKSIAVLEGARRE